MLSQVADKTGGMDRPLSIDVFFPTYDEDPELVRLSILDAKKITYPHKLVNIKIYVLDDGDRASMKKVAEEEGVSYITREGNAGFKAGNMRNAMEQTSGDFIVICDADTRPFPTILEHTMGYFRDPDVAWVQTPQWFYDLPEGKPLPEYLKKFFWYPGKWAGHIIELVIGKVKVGEDPFVSDPKMFYDIILRRRNWANAAFCCGAGSIHRRDAVMQAALKRYGKDVEKKLSESEKKLTKLTKEKEIDEDTARRMRSEIAREEELTPYRFHVSEDIYTSMILHSDETRKWKSVQHPEVESKMLSPQDLLSWSMQRFKYAGGTLDIALNDNPLFEKGMTFHQKIMYGATIWSYLGGIWNLIFLLSPLVYFYTGIAPVDAYSLEFFGHFLPFLIAHEIATMFGTWGLPGYRAKAGFIAFFWHNLRALWTVLNGKKISFPVTPKDRQEGNFAHIVWPHILIFLLTAGGIAFSLTAYYMEYGAYYLNAIVLNIFWGLNNMMALLGIIKSAFWKPED